MRRRAIHPGALRAQIRLSLQAGLRAYKCEGDQPVAPTRLAPSHDVTQWRLQTFYLFTVAGAAWDLFAS